jgi:hypothetical protein
VTTVIEIPPANWVSGICAYCGYARSQNHSPTCAEDRWVFEHPSMRVLNKMIEHSYASNYARAVALEKKRDALEVVLREEFRKGRGQ